jgi:hypothetical protein
VGFTGQDTLSGPFEISWVKPGGGADFIEFMNASSAGIPELNAYGSAGGRGKGVVVYGAGDGNFNATIQGFNPTFDKLVFDTSAFLGFTNGKITNSQVSVVNSANTYTVDADDRWLFNDMEDRLYYIGTTGDSNSRVAIAQFSGANGSPFSVDANQLAVAIRGMSSADISSSFGDQPTSLAGYNAQGAYAASSTAEILLG